MGSFGACLLTYHHKGAPRYYTIVSPIAHDMIETLLYDACKSPPALDLDKACSLGPTPPPEAEDHARRKPPSCSQFVSHTPTYLPCQTLAAHDISYTQMTQYEGELVVTFPYAYQQGYNAGPNIVETMMYASSQLDILHEEKLYRLCNRNCVKGKSDSFDLTFVRNGTLTPRRGRRHSRAQDDSSTVKGHISNDGNNTRENHANISPISSGLRAMDRIADDGPWQETLVEDNISQGQSSSPFKKRKVECEKKIDMWNVESILEDVDDDMSPPPSLRKINKRSRKKH